MFLKVISYLNGKVQQTFRSAFDRLSTIFGKMDARTEQALRQGIEDWMKKVITRLRRRHSTVWPAGTKPMSLSTRSGSIFNMVGRVSTVNKKEVKGTIDVPAHLMAHEEGQSIIPVSKKYLAIPLRAVMTQRGMKKYKSPLDIANTFVLVSRSGESYIAQRQGKGRGIKVVLLYKLSKRVRFPARFKFFETVNQYFPEFAGKVKAGIFANLI